MWRKTKQQLKNKFEFNWALNLIYYLYSMMYDFLGFIIYKKNWDQIIYCYLLLHILYCTVLQTMWRMN